MEYYPIEKLRDADKYAIEHLGIPQKQLMENAGRGVAEYIIRNYSKDRFLKVIIVCGKGNNGGDGLVVERLLKDKSYIAASILLPSTEKLPPADLYVDAIFGTGLKGPVTGVYKNIIEAMNNSRKPIIAVDIPSGINGDNGPTGEAYIKPAATITFVAKKLFMQKKPELFGEIVVVDIGIPLSGQTSQSQL